MAILLYKKALEKFGQEAQVLKLCEEMGELAQAVVKQTQKGRWKHRVAEEIGDVELMLAQMKYIFKVNGEVLKYKNAKLKRLRAKLIKKEK